MSTFRVRAVFAACLLALGCGMACAQDITLETDAFTWKLSPVGKTLSLIDRASGDELCTSSAPAFELVSSAGRYAPSQVALAGEQLSVQFAENAGRCVFAVDLGSRHVLLRLLELDCAAEFQSLTLCRLFVPKKGLLASVVNAWRGDESAVAIIGLNTNVRPGGGAGPGGSGGSASPGASALATYTEEAKVGAGAARLVGRNPKDGVAWACWYNHFDRPLDLRGHAGIGAWVKGDGKGELLKIQLHDGIASEGHWRDYYITIDFTGWRWCELPKPEGEAIDYSRVKSCNLYFNGIPASTDVECVVDDIRALRELTGEPSENADDWVLADFEDMQAPYFDLPATIISADCLAQYGTDGAGVAVVACPARELPEAIEEVELAAGLPSVHFDGAWSKTSPDVTRSYLFITSMAARDTEDVIEFAHKCGFSDILIGQGSWSASLGHFPINTNNFPGGIDELRDTVKAFQAEGFRCGLHFLAAAISQDDAYVTPIPDDRLVTDFYANVGGDVDEKSDFIPTAEPPTDFPPTEEGYMGNSSIIRVGDELISYGSLSLQEPYGFKDCHRGMYGTAAAAHKTGDSVRHLMRSYGTFLHDPDNGLTQEVARNLGAVANAVGADMLYFDGSERLKGPHWRYNAILHKAYWDALDDPTRMLMQASSVSHFSYHMLSRYASADGHGDLKWYLDQRIPSFQWYSNNMLPLDLGWYYIYGDTATPDQIEYVCQKSIGFNCSVSIQTNPMMIRKHPRMNEFIDIIRKYEDLRLSGKVSDEMRAHLRVPGEEYMLTPGDDGNAFKRAQWFDPVTVTPDAAPEQLKVTVDPELGRARLGVEIRAGQQVAPGPEYNDQDNWLLEDFEDLSPYGAGGGDGLARDNTGTNLAGSTNQGVTQRLEAVTEGAKLGQQCARYTATSTRTDDGGWSAVGKRFAAPPDLREHVGLGVWIHGDNSGAKLKIQPRGTHGHAQDYYIPITFAGWRFFVLERPEKPYPEAIEYDAVTSLTFYYNGIPAGKTCTVLIDGLKALRRIADMKTPAPVLQIGDKTLRFDADLGDNSAIVLRGGGNATLMQPGGETQALAIAGDFGELAPGENVIEIRPSEDRQQTRELFVRAFVVYD